MKIIFIGPMGAGKTTAISAVSDIEPITTEADNNDQLSSAKATTTVAMDYGEIVLSDSDTVALYGIPGQERFAFMWPILAQGAMGAVLLLDDRMEQPQAQLATYLDAFAELAEKGALVIGVGRVSEPVEPRLALYRALLDQRELALPLFVTDVRQKQNVLLLIESLIATAEANQLLDI